ncbi:MAG TPA: hypothetical protein PK413_05065 [Thermoanaerobaculia bacterium]|nr:hypothetical protein [Thermoanaerobaculia bacterium]
MIDAAIRQEILEDLERLPVELQEQARELVHGLVLPRPKGASPQQAMALAGTVDDESAQRMVEAIEEEFERVEIDAL